MKHTTLARTIVAAAAAVGLFTGVGTATAGVDSSNSIVDDGDRTVAAIAEDTRIEFVPPLDGNPLTREWFHHGRAGFRITGPDADEWRGHITIGYMVGFPATLNGKIKFQYQTPGLSLELGSEPKLNFFDLIPRAGVELEVGFGPGIKTIDCTGGDIAGPEGFIRMSGFHGTVTGVLGPTTIRPYVKLTSADGDMVVTYGPLSTI
ncbi:MspA family porin [Nocardia sp. CDC159]|uniref:MspA family porin n=1 Tax=Nocardia pulmonis TaxID=2951408 RepID=A0A9X2IWS7_9NOCA|nr:MULTISPECIES: MspA family porin [Nocardia]MCM6772181.1 MspA family porin [Nocardia pulmonis]MCM6785161.1 MspA family porin [Nocardia sp. CDC159]